MATESTNLLHQIAYQQYQCPTAPNYIPQSKTGYGDWGGGPQELAPLFLML